MEFGNLDTLIICIFVLAVGNAITARLKALQNYSIPPAVTGGIIASLIVFFIQLCGGPSITFRMELRDLLLLIFFSTIGLSAKFNRLKAGGLSLVVLILCAAVYLIIQNVTGVLLAKLSGIHPGYGLFGGSISFAGGHGTAIAWGQEAEAAGIANASMVGVAFATFGLIAGGLIGGPIAERLIRKHQLTTGQDGQQYHMMTADSPHSGNGRQAGDSMRLILVNITILAVCISAGDSVNDCFVNMGLKLPGFLTAMLVGILITNLADVMKKNVRQQDFDRIGEVCLQLFLGISLMSMNLAVLSQAMGSMMIVLFIQMLIITVFSMHVVFRLLGKDYDAAVIASGFAGLGLGATPVAIANMNSVTSKYSPSFKAFLLIPLVGAFFVDIMNALIIKFFIGLPMMQM